MIKAGYAVNFTNLFMTCLQTFRVAFVTMSHLRPSRRSGWSQAGLWTKATPSIKWSQNNSTLPRGQVALKFELPKTQVVQ